MIKIILVEDQQIVRKSLQALLNSNKGIEVIAAVSGAKNLFELLKADIEADIVLSDVVMPEIDGIAMISEIKKYNSQLKVVMLSILEDLKYVQESFEAGARAYLSKDVDENELLFALNQVMNGNRYLSSELSISVLEKFKNWIKNQSTISSAPLPLSEREQLVLSMIANGMTNQEISDKIFLSRRTVEGIRQILLERSGCKNSASLIKFAVLNGYVT